jgi:hypothetical protein
VDAVADIFGDGWNCGTCVNYTFVAGDWDLDVFLEETAPEFLTRAMIRILISGGTEGPIFKCFSK